MDCSPEAAAGKALVRVSMVRWCMTPQSRVMTSSSHRPSAGRTQGHQPCKVAS